MLPPPFLTTSKIAIWALGSLLSVVLFVVLAYGKYTTDTLAKHDERITDAAVEVYHIEADLAVTNAKMDLLLQGMGLRYIGPTFLTHEQFHNPPGPKK